MILTQVFLDFLSFPFTVTVILAVPFFFAFRIPFFDTVTTLILLLLKVTDFLFFLGDTLTLMVVFLPFAKVYVFFVTVFA